MKLSTKTCDAAKPKDKPYRISDGHGLFLEVMPNGSKYWRLRYRYAGKEKVLALGVYDTIGLKEARERREKARKLIANNIDPVMAKKEQRMTALNNAANTFESLARDWHDNWKVDKTHKHAAAILSRFENDVFPHIGKLPVNSITPQMILQVVRRSEARDALDVARRIKQTCSQIFCFGVANGRAERDITVDLRGAMRPYKMEHFAALDIRELPEFLRKLDHNEMCLQKQARIAMKFLMLTFVRTSEMINASWDEFDFKEAVWIIPAARMKMRRDHIVPLSRQVLAMLEELKEMNGSWKWVFPNMVRPRNPMSNATIVRAIMRMGYKDRMTGHGFRALAMTTIKEKLGYRHEVADRQLAHAHRARSLLPMIAPSSCLIERR